MKRNYFENLDSLNKKNNNGKERDQEEAPLRKHLGEDPLKKVTRMLEEIINNQNN
jgi:hypothetical protein